MQGHVTISGADDLKRRLEQANAFLQGDVFEIVGIEGLNHFRESFQNEGFTDQSLEKWASRKTKRISRNEQKVLSDTGELGDSLDFRIDGSTVVFYTDKAYAQIHNEGGTITVTDKMRKYFWARHKEAKDAELTDIADQWMGMALSDKITIVKRQYIGDSAVLMLKIEEKIFRELDKIFKS